MMCRGDADKMRGCHHLSPPGKAGGDSKNNSYNSALSAFVTTVTTSPPLAYIRIVKYMSDLCVWLSLPLRHSTKEKVVTVVTGVTTLILNAFFCHHLGSRW